MTDRKVQCHCVDPARPSDKGHRGRADKWAQTVDFDGKIESG